MPWTIYRYILWDLIKLLLLTTVVLVTVISFAAAIKPMSDGLLSAAALAKFVAYTTPTMLAFALPFAGAFAATIVFLRLAADNEITAMSASGISYGSILAPVLGLGVVLTITLFYLSNFVIPSFYRAAAQTVEADVMQLLVSNLNQNRPFDMDEAVLYADSATQRPLSREEILYIGGEVPPSQLIELTGVAVGQIERGGRVRGDVTAERANVLVFRDDDRSWVDILCRNVMRYDEPTDQLFFSERFDIGPIELPTPLKDQPEFLSWRDLQRLKDEPERVGDIAEMKRKLADELAAERLRILLQASLTQGDGAVRMVGLSGGEEYVIRSPQVRSRPGRVELRDEKGRPVLVEAFSNGRPTRRYEATAGTMSIFAGGAGEQPGAMIELEHVKVFAPGETEPATERAVLPLPSMAWPEPVVRQDLQQLDYKALIELSEQPPFNASESVGAAARGLGWEIVELAYRVEGQKHQRAATAVSCLLLLLLGAVLSMKLKSQTPLVVYFWSFALAIITLIIIHTGTNLAGSAKYPLIAALGTLWLGNVILAVVVGVVYCRLARN